MKKIINKPEDIVREMCNGIVLAHPSVVLVSKYMVIKKKNLNKNKVSLISGGGSGHEPAHAGFIGEGMLDAAVCGDVFASPSQIQVYGAIRETAGNKGTLLIIKNYSGDMMNFKNAAALAREDGITVDYVKVDDDIAVQDSLYTVGCRGVAGTIFVHKIAGAAAEKGLSLPEVKSVAEKVVKNVHSIGFALTSCTVPAKGSPTFELSGDEMEYGVGIHGEPGIRREKMMDAKSLAKRMTDSLCGELGFAPDGTKHRVAVLINGFGGTPLLELYLFNNAVSRELSEKNIEIARVFVGNFMTSIDMAGASLSILKLDSELESLLNSPCDTPAFKVNGPSEPSGYSDPFEAAAIDESLVCFEIETPDKYAVIAGDLTVENMVYIVDVMSEAIIKNEVPFCELDSHAGDGDFGMSIAKGFRQLKREWKNITAAPGLDIGAFLGTCALIIMEHCGGASGPIWGSAFRWAGKQADGKKSLTTTEFAGILQVAVKGIQITGERSFGRGAVVGDKTLIDALVPCADAWSAGAKEGLGFGELFAKGAEAAVAGAKSTEKIVARMGRAGTAGERSLGYPDAGAYGLGVIFGEIAKAVRTE
ncbi:MAG: dihydroxyacetone kinase subunit DhaK [Synergistaceae bacterium]|jgi:dihydroxyacetone kinase|nr:dihydroxyacetone kinase subunit DhaK [Synergistaceae bacterium]